MPAYILLFSIYENIKRLPPHYTAATIAPALPLATRPAFPV